MYFRDIENIKTYYGGPAFPIKISDNAGRPYFITGMTLRDYFAGQALISCQYHPWENVSHRAVASWCYAVADELIKARSS